MSNRQSALVFACLIPLLSISLSNATAADGGSPHEPLEPAFELLERTYKRGLAGYRIGDFVVKREGRASRKYNRDANAISYDSVHAVIAPTGGRAEVKSERQDFYSLENLPESSLGAVLADMALEAVTGVSIIDDDPEEVLVKTTVHASISLTVTPGEIWQLEAEKLPIPGSRDFGSQSEWGYGVLTNGERALEYTYRGASPWSGQECQQMLLARDKRTEQCHRKLTEIKEAGELLAWKDKFNQYNFRAGLDVDTMLLVLAMLHLVD